MIDVKSNMITRSVLLFFALSTTLLAEGSVAYEAIREMIPQNARQHLEASFKISEVGIGTRLGRHYGEVGGARIGPYYFEATSNVTRLPCTIGIFTAASIVDRNGREVQDPGTAARINESYDFYEVRFADQPQQPGGVAPGQPHHNPPAGNLSAAEKTAVVDHVRAVYADVERTELEFDGGQLKSDDEMSGDIIRGYSRTGAVRKVEFNVATGDHGGFTVEVFCDQNGVPSFVLWEESYWSFDTTTPNKTIDTITERRFYFSPDGQLARALEKSFSGSGDQEIARNREAAVNHDFPAKAFGIPNFFNALAGIVKCNDTELKGYAEKLWAAQDQMIGH